jgi:hypothetical protein
MEPVAYAASIGHAVWFSHDRGEHWQRAHTTTGGIYNESRCWAIAVHRERPGEVLAGTDQGIYRWDPRAEHWVYLPSELDQLQVLQLAIAPHDPDLVFAGTRPAEVFRSRDGGRTWSRCRLDNARTCRFITTPRVTSIHFDPREPETIWVTIEIDGIYRSRDGGDHWEHLGDGLLTDDVHTLAIIDEAGPRRILVATEEGLHRSDDGGERYAYVPVDATNLRYFRTLVARADRSGVLFLSAGDRPSGETGELLRSRDWGEHWEAVPMPARVNSTIWSIAVNEAAPHLLFFCTIMGQVWRSDDGGERWQKLERELGELRMLAWAPRA